MFFAGRKIAAELRRDPKDLEKAGRDVCLYEALRKRAGGLSEVLGIRTRIVWKVEMATISSAARSCA
jgi:hypothetical protein